MTLNPKWIKEVCKKCSGIEESSAKLKAFKCNICKTNQVATSSKVVDLAGDLIKKRVDTKDD